MLYDTDIVAVDTETTGLNPWIGDRPFGVSLATPDGRSTWVEWVVDPYTREVDYDHQSYRDIKKYLEDGSIAKVFFNAPFDLRMLEFAGIDVQGDIHECSIACRICGVEKYLWKLKSLCKHYFEISDEDESTLKKYVQTLRSRAKLLKYNLGEVLEQDYWLIQNAGGIMLSGLRELRTWQSASIVKRKQLETIARQHAKMMRNSAKEYATTDAVRTIVAWMYFKEELKRKNLWDLYDEECDLLLNVTYPMITKGIQTNEQTVTKGSHRAKKLKAMAKWKLNTTFWNGFNPRSVNDKRRYFIDYKKLAPLSFSKTTSEPSVDNAFLEYHASKEPGAKAIINYVAAGKAKSTYFDWMVANHDSDWVLHPDLNQYGTITGRYSGRFLTIPKRANDGSIMLDVRKCFEPRHGCYWLMADYSQIEARVYADEFEEQTMLDAFKNNRDVYEELDECIYTNVGVRVGRQVAKNIFLGKIYGLGVDHMIEMIMNESHADVNSEGANETINAFNETFPGVSEGMKEIAKKVERQGFVRNRYGQVVYVPYDFAYKGVNYIIQSTAQRIIKRAMLRLNEELLIDSSDKMWLLLQMHDELIFECRNGMSAKKIAKSIKPIMEDDEGMFPLVNLTVDFEMTKTNWLERVEL